MGKNDVEILIKARDAVGPGVQSARQNLSRFGVDANKALDMGAAGLKAAAVINGIRGAFDIGSAALRLFKGDGEGAMQMLERLPLGIGGAIRSVKDFGRELFATNQELVRLGTLGSNVTLAVAGGEGFRRRMGANPVQAAGTAVADRFRAEEAKLMAARKQIFEGGVSEGEITRKSKLGFPLTEQEDKARKLMKEIDKEYEELWQRRKEEVAKVKAETEVSIKVKMKESMEAVEKGLDFYFDEVKKIDDADYRNKILKLNREQDMFGTAFNQDGTPWRGVGPRYDAQGFKLQFNMATPMRFGTGSNIGELDAAALAQQRRMFAGGGLPSGASDRFGTGLVAAAQDRIQTEAAKQTKLAEQQVELLKKIVEGRDTPSNQIILNGNGIFGGQA